MKASYPMTIPYSDYTFILTVLLECKRYIKGDCKQSKEDILQGIDDAMRLARWDDESYGTGEHMNEIRYAIIILSDKELRLCKDLMLHEFDKEIDALINFAEDALKVGKLVEKKEENYRDMKCHCVKYDDGKGETTANYCDCEPSYVEGFNECHDMFTKALALRVQGLEEKIDLVKEEFDKWIDCTGACGGLNTSYYYECVSFFDDIKHSIKTHLLGEKE